MINDIGILADLANAKNAATAAERAAVVAWLRALSADRIAVLHVHGFSRELGILADAVENGKHRREEKP